MNNAFFLFLACCALAPVNLAKRKGYLHSRDAEINAVTRGATSNRRVCYYAQWSAGRPAGMTYPPSKIAANLCDYIIFAFAYIDTSDWGLKNSDGSKTHPLYAQLNNLKASNPNLKTLLSVGGGTMPISSMTSMLQNDARMNTFVTKSVQYAKDNGFDGIDLDFEYPGNTGKGSPAEDAVKFPVLVTRLATALHAQGMLLTSAMQSTNWNMMQAYGGASGTHVPTICGAVDFINVMTYDMWGSWGNWGGEWITGHHAPIVRPSNGPSMKHAAEWFSGNGCPKSKIVLGIPFYAVQNTLKTSDSSLGALVSGWGTAGPILGDTYSLAYYEVCKLKSEGGVYHNLPAEQGVRYMTYGGNNWVAFDDPTSIGLKTTWIKQNGYGGALAWALDHDDFENRYCGQGPAPLLNALSQGMQ